MPDQIINIPGVGDVAFPDTMSEDEITAAAKRLHEGGSVPRQGDLKPVSRTITDFMPDAGPIGVVKGAVDSALSTGAGIRRLLGAAGEATGIDLPGVDIGITADEYADRRRAFSPGTPAERIGRTAEQMAEFVVPAGRVAKATEAAIAAPKVAASLTRAGVKATPKLAARVAAAAPTATRAVTQGATAGVVGAAHEGDLEGGAIPGLTAGAMPVLGAGLQRLGQRVMGSTMSREAVEKARDLLRAQKVDEARRIPGLESMDEADLSIIPNEWREARNLLAEDAIQHRLTPRSTFFRNGNEFTNGAAESIGRFRSPGLSTSKIDTLLKLLLNPTGAIVLDDAGKLMGSPATSALSAQVLDEFERLMKERSSQ